LNGYSGPRPRTLRSLAALLGLGLACLLVAASPASAAKRHVPFGFLGTVVDPAMAYGENAATLDAQYALMARNGIESVRTNFDWRFANPGPGVYDWTVTDNIMLAAGKHGLDVLPIVEFTPYWASSQPGNHGTLQPPADYGTFATFMTAAVERYGPNGAFWKAHPELKADPIRQWQIWNEPAGDFDWKPSPWAPPYVKLLKAGYKAIKKADKHAKVVSGAVVGLNTTTLTPWKELSDLYRLGARKYMDVVAVNAFTAALNDQSAKAAVDRNLELYRRVRRVMSRHGDAKKPIYNTEVTWTSALGKVKKKYLAGFETTQKGQAQRMTEYFSRVAKDQKLRIKRVYWYTWFSGYTPARSFNNIPSFQYAGLTAHDAVGKPFRRKPLLSAYARIAAKLEGGRKSDDARTYRGGKSAR
jgi:hypothetical protein